MNSSQLKLLAMITMLLDHIAWVLFPQIKIFHIIGKLAFPIFCYMISEGYLKTRDKKKYLIRLLGIALISQLPFSMTFKLAFGEYFYALNTIFNLVLGLIAIWLYDNSKGKYKILYVWILSILGLVLAIDGDFTGVWMIYFFYKYHDDFNKMAKKIVMIVFISTGVYILQIIIMGITAQAPVNIIISYLFSANIFDGLLAIFALIPIKFYNGLKGRNVKWLFYLFYPAHLLAIYAIRVFLM